MDIKEKAKLIVEKMTTGENPADDGSIMACTKHFIGYGESTGAKDAYDTPVTYRKARAKR